MTVHVVLVYSDISHSRDIAGIFADKNLANKFVEKKYRKDPFTVSSTHQKIRRAVVKEWCVEEDECPIS